MSETFEINFNVEISVHQKIIPIKNSNGEALKTKEEIIDGLRKGHYLTTLNSDDKSYIVNLKDKKSGQEPEKIAFVISTSIFSNDPDRYSDFENI